MKIIKLEYSDKKQLDCDRVHIQLHKIDNRLYFTISLYLDGLELNPEYNVHTKAHYAGETQRFELGTVGNLRTQQFFEINDIHNTELLYFDTMIVAKDRCFKGYIYNSRVGVKDCVKTKTESILPVNAVELNNQFYKVSYGPLGPVLEINKKIPNIRQLAESNHLCRLTMYVPAFKEILRNIMFSDYDGNDDSCWESKWIKYTRTQLRVLDTPSLGKTSKELTEEQEEWIERCADQLSSQKKLLENLIYSITA